MKRSKMSRSGSRRQFKANAGTHRFNMRSPVTRGGIRL